MLHEPLKVFIVTDHALLCAGIEAVLGARPDRFVLVGHASALARDAAPWEAAEPDVLLIDLALDPEAVHGWLVRLREDPRIKCVALSATELPAAQDRAILDGARGLVDRRCTPELLQQALELVGRGEVWFDHAAMSRLLHTFEVRQRVEPPDAATRQMAQLSPREQSILRVMIVHAGEPAKVLADRLHISESTLRNHLTSIYDKVGVPNKSALLMHAVKNGFTQHLGIDMPSAPGVVDGQVPS